MGTELNGITVAFVVSNEGIEEAELRRPWEHVQQGGATPKLVAIDPGEVELMNHLETSGRFPVDLVTGDVRAADFNALVLPGGVHAPPAMQGAVRRRSGPPVGRRAEARRDRHAAHERSGPSEQQ